MRLIDADKLISEQDVYFDGNRTVSTNSPLYGNGSRYRSGDQKGTGSIVSLRQYEAAESKWLGIRTEIGIGIILIREWAVWWPGCQYRESIG